MSEEITEVMDQEMVETTETDVEDVEETNEEVDVEETTDEEVNEEEQEEEKAFDPDDIDFDDDEDLYKFGGYDLSKFKDALDVSNEDVVADFNNTAKELAEHGFTQEQIEYLVERAMEQPQEEVKEPTREDIIKELKDNLTVSERRDYKNVGSYLKEQLKGTDLEGYYNEAMSNPGVFKLVHALYSKATNKGRPVNNINTNKETRTKMTLTNAFDEYEKYMKAHLHDTTGRKDFVKSLTSKLSKSDKNKFNEVLGL